ncbi:M15 family metallopeptidase [Nocardioides sp.]|uniref:M15 family metallopeptidase n=1 Tax=Nocardioides sp. TaxID=35761 RepID=UPI0039E58CC6
MRRAWALGTAALLLAGCGAAPSVTLPPASAPATPTSTTAPATSASPATAPPATTRPEPGTVPPGWLGTRVLPTTAAGYAEPQPTPPELVDRRFTLPDSLPELPGTGFASRVEQAPAEVLARSTWDPACPVAGEDLSWIRLTFWGFDDARHTGELLVRTEVADDVVAVFRQLYRDRFPIEEMRITTVAERDAPPTGDGNNTSAFNCRPARGATSWSEHAYGEAIDVNPFQNPYVKGTGASQVVLPELATSYTDRGDVRPGMILPDGPVVQAFASIGWGWGGAWHSLQDLQHFSLHDR